MTVVYDTGEGASDQHPTGRKQTVSFRFTGPDEHAPDPADYLSDLAAELMSRDYTSLTVRVTDDDAACNWPSRLMSRITDAVGEIVQGVHDDRFADENCARWSPGSVTIEMTAEDR